MAVGWLHHVLACLPLPLLLTIHILSTNKLLPSRSARLFSVIWYICCTPCFQLIIWPQKCNLYVKIHVYSTYHGLSSYWILSVGYELLILCWRPKITDHLSLRPLLICVKYFFQLPNNVNVSVQIYQERKTKLEEHVRSLPAAFKRIRAIYNTVQEHTSHLDNVPVEVNNNSSYCKSLN